MRTLLNVALLASLFRTAYGRVGSTATGPQHRSLFLHTEKADGFCTSEGKPIFAKEDFGAFAFHKKFDPKCTCVDEDNVVSQLSMLEEAVGSPDFVEVFRRGIKDFRGEKSYECINGCEVCLDNGSHEEEDVKTCGIIESDVAYNFNSAKDDGDFDLKEILSGDVVGSLEPRTMLARPDYTVEFCIKYTSGHEGRFCMGAEIKASTDDDDHTCFVGHDGHICSSCDIAEEDGRYCLTMDCSNLGAEYEGTMNTCHDDLPGMFEFVDVFFNQPEPKFSVGTCGDYKSMHD